MTPEAIRLVRESWSRVEGTRRDLARSYYFHLFAIAPHKAEVTVATP